VIKIGAGKGVQRRVVRDYRYVLKNTAAGSEPALSVVKICSLRKQDHAVLVFTTKERQKMAEIILLFV
jgi:hypothetical protein